MDLHSDSDDFDYPNNHPDADNYLSSSSNYDNQSQQSNHMENSGINGALSKAELRKTNKPIMEKRRRARINHCLNELKSLILEAMKKDPSRHTKLEKADILEMTVKHLQSIQRQQLNMAIQTDPTVIHKFKSGFMECADEVNRYINQMDDIDAAVKLRLNNHLNNCATNLDQMSSMAQFSNGYGGWDGTIPNAIFNSTITLPTLAAATSAAQQSNVPLFGMNNIETIGCGPTLFSQFTQDLNNNQGASIQMGGVRLIPSRLPSGEFALIMPNFTNDTNQNPNQNPHLNAHSNLATISASTTISTLTPTTTTTTPSASASASASTPNSNSNPTPIPIPFAISNQHLSNSKLLNDGGAAGGSANGSQMGNGVSKLSTLSNEMALRNNLKRLSAFSKVQATPNASSPSMLIALGPNCNSSHQYNLFGHQSTATGSPPLSPISAISSQNDDSSVTHNSSDYVNSQENSQDDDEPANEIVMKLKKKTTFCGVLNTSTALNATLNAAMSISCLQHQPVVSSTSGCTSTPIMESTLNTNRNGLTALKRASSEAIMDSGFVDSFDEALSPCSAGPPSTKKLHRANDERTNDSQPEKEETRGDYEQENMWRPW